jgi:lysozyme family protein
MARAGKALADLRRLEGYYSNHESDVGGRTAFGIAEAYWPQYWAEWVDMPTWEQAQQFYIKEFWGPLKLETLHDQSIANEVFEQAVNLGHKRAIRFWQVALCLVRGAGCVYIDGQVGPQTLNATNRLNAADALRVSKVLNGIQFMYYIYRTNSLDDVMALFKTMPKEDQKVFFRGWLKRISFGE